MKRIITVIIILLSLLIFSIISRDHIIESQRQEIIALELEIFELKQACESAEVLRQILPPVAKDELALQAEKLKQEKENPFHR